jgi:capsid protein
MILTLANDTIGSGPRLQIRDKRLSDARKRLIERRFHEWAALIKLRQKLWRMRVAKAVDGEAFALEFSNPRLRYPIQLDYQVIECDRFSSLTLSNNPKVFEIDGVRFDKWDQPSQYHLLDQHPGAQLVTILSPAAGKWVPARFVIHWFRQDRGWLRGIPETTPSLPLCAVLRRYTLATLHAAEFAASQAGLLHTEGPPSSTVWTDGAGNIIEDEPFDTFPIEIGQLTNLPWGYKVEQLKAEHPITTYNVFVHTLLMEIARPILLPFNMAVGSSKDSNMASAIVDSHIYKEGIRVERLHCNESVLDPSFGRWWQEAILDPSYLDDPALDESDFLVENPSLRFTAPEHDWNWDRVGLDHTDPARVAVALKTLKGEGFLTDRQIQEQYYNRDVDDWRADISEDVAFRRELGITTPGQKSGTPTEPSGRKTTSNGRKTTG